MPAAWEKVVEYWLELRGGGLHQDLFQLFFLRELQAVVVSEADREFIRERLSPTADVEQLLVRYQQIEQTLMQYQLYQEALAKEVATRLLNEENIS